MVHGTSRVLQNGRKKISQVHSIISNRDIDLTARRLLLISVVRPTLEYGSKVWEGNKAQAAALESVMIGGAKRILGCSSRTCNEAVRGDMGLDSLQGRRDKAKLKWWYKVATMPEHRYSRKLFVQEWNVKPRRGRQRKYWCKVVDHLFSSLGLDKAEWLEDIRKGICSLKSFLGVAGEGIDERESGKFEEGLNSKVKLSLYRKIVEFKKYLRGVGDAGTRLLFKFRSGTHGLNEELGRHRGREGRKECLLCDAECESVSHVLWDCPAYVSIRSAFMLELRRELGDRFEHFQSLDSFEKSSYVLGSEAWEEYSSGLLGLIKDFVLSVWEERKVRLYGEHTNVHQSHSQNDSGDLRGVAGGDGELGCLCGKAGTSHLCDGSAHSSGCVVNGYGCRLSYY